MDAVAVPDLVGPVAHPLVQKGIVGLVRCASNLFCVNAFRPFLENIGNRAASGFVKERESGLHAERHAVGRMPDILALGIIGGRIGRFDAGAEPFCEFRQESPVQPVGLPCLVPRGEFQHVHREIARFQEHGREHVLPFHLLEGEGAGKAGAFPMADALGGGSRLPLRGRGESGMEAAGLVTAIELRRPLYGTVRAQAHEPDLLAPEGQRDEEAKDEGSGSRFHRNRCWNCWYRQGPRSRSRPRRPRPRADAACGP